MGGISNPSNAYPGPLLSPISAPFAAQTNRTVRNGNFNLPFGVKRAELNVRNASTLSASGILVRAVSSVAGIIAAGYTGNVTESGAGAVLNAQSAGTGLEVAINWGLIPSFDFNVIFTRIVGSTWRIRINGYDRPSDTIVNSVGQVTFANADLIGINVAIADGIGTFISGDGSILFEV